MALLLVDDAPERSCHTRQVSGDTSAELEYGDYSGRL
jgi:hypothetical protein